MIKDKQQFRLLKQQSLNHRLMKEEKGARQSAEARGLNAAEQDIYIRENLASYQKTEIVRLAVKEVKKRGQELAQKRKMQGTQYEGVKSKIASNMRVIDRVNRKQGFNQNTYAAKKKPQSASVMQKRKTNPVRKHNDSSLRATSAMGQQLAHNIVNQQHSIIRAAAAGADEDILARFKERAQKIIASRPQEIPVPQQVVARPNFTINKQPRPVTQLKQQTTEELEVEIDDFFGAELQAKQETINISVDLSNEAMSRWKRQQSDKFIETFEKSKISTQAAQQEDESRLQEQQEATLLEQQQSQLSQTGMRDEDSFFQMRRNRSMRKSIDDRLPAAREPSANAKPPNVAFVSSMSQVKSSKTTIGAAFKTVEPVMLSEVKRTKIDVHGVNKTPMTMASSVVKQQNQSATATAVHQIEPMIRDWDANSMTQQTQVPLVSAQNNLAALREKADKARKLLDILELSALVELKALSDGTNKTIVAFANFHMMNETTENDIRGCRLALKKIGKLLSILSYFDIDNIKDEQAQVALAFNVSANQVEEQISHNLHTYMISVHEYVAQKQRH